MTRALVLGGGGITGIAWEFGVLAGLHAAGAGPGDADTVIGTAAGSGGGSVVAPGLDLTPAVQFQRAEAAGGGARPAVDLAPALEAFAVLADRSRPRAESVAIVGAMALA